MNTTWCILNQLLNPLKNTFEREDIFFRVERANAISGQRSRSGRLGHQLNELLKVNGAIAVLINAPHHALAGGHGDILPHGAEHAVELLGGDEASKQRAELAPAVLGWRSHVLRITHAFIATGLEREREKYRAMSCRPVNGGYIYTYIYIW